MASATSSKANGTQSKNDVSIDDLSAQIDVLKSDIATLTSTIGDLGKAKAEEAATKAQNVAADIKESSYEAGLKAQDTAIEYIQKQPTTALGMAAGLGFLVGMMTARR
ncbi:DUF883 family protein [Sulfitobacter aestuariivivens]|uniref:DUF883 family protein n=1 Tax=Sulfitobacter aestuariivivens TaxID=2766981 RepID=A0A927D7A8_9RHOB|nr:DUF883 C-terminal domain-containing protein [Sulfitobacter aestuariivivens]MBD3665114.1 DUF883 family protein [Sulfitobacter aestuariivivens]